MTTTYMSDNATHAQDPTALLRWTHAVLTHELGLKSPLGPAVDMLDRLTALDLARASGVQAARDAREKLARQVALGEREFDEAALLEWSRGSLWVADFHGAGTYQAAVTLGEAVARGRDFGADVLQAADTAARPPGLIFVDREARLGVVRWVAVQSCEAPEQVVQA